MIEAVLGPDLSIRSKQAKETEEFKDTGDAKLREQWEAELKTLPKEINEPIGTHSSTFTYTHIYITFRLQRHVS